MSMPNCPKCNGEYTYDDGTSYVCPDCFHEWTQRDMEILLEEATIKDAFGNELKDGDNVTIIKDLKVKGSSDVLKQGTKVKGILLRDTGDGHDISCKIAGFGSMNLKSEVVKKI